MGIVPYLSTGGFMNIQITARHFNSSPQLQDRIQDEVSSLDKFYPGITDAFVVLDAEKKHLRSVEIRLNIRDKSLAAHAEEENMGKALDSALTKIQRQLTKEKEKLTDHKSQPVVDLV